MKKRYSIEIADQCFFFDPKAEKTLETYLDTLTNHYSKEEGGEEILYDIECRIAELIPEFLTKDGTSIVRPSHIDNIIMMMGTPEDLFQDEEDPENTTNSTFTAKDTNTTANSQPSIKTPRKLYRDIDHKMIGGVCAGLSAYFNVDVVWIRLIFVLFLLFYGATLLLYLVFWIVTPVAITVQDKIKMNGNPINVSTLEKKIKEQYQNTDVKENLSEIGNKVGSILSKLFNVFGTIFKVILDFFIKFFALIFGSAAFISIISFTYVLFLYHWQDSVSIQFEDYLLLTGNFGCILSYMVGIFVAIPPLLLILLWSLKQFFKFSYNQKLITSLFISWVVGIILLILISLHVHLLT